MGVGVLGAQASAESSRIFYKVPVSLYRPGDLIEEDLYFLYQGQYVLFRMKNLAWKREDTERLNDFEVTHLYVPFVEKRAHQKFLEERLNKVLDSSQVSEKEKAKILYGTSIAIVEDIFQSPSSTEELRRSMNSVKNTIHFLGRDRMNFFQLMELASADFSEYSHALHTAAYAIQLAHQMGIKGFNQISSIGIAALLHDIGKTRLPRSVLEKNGPLDQEERKLVETHPVLSFEIVKESRSIPEISETMILQHHERPTKKGYPKGLGSEIHVFTRIISLADCFDSLTSDRVFQKAYKPVTAIEMLRTELKDEYDQNLVIEFIKMLKR